MMSDDFDVDINLRLSIRGIVVVVPLVYPLRVHNGPFHLGTRHGKQVNLDALRAQPQALQT